MDDLEHENWTSLESNYVVKLYRNYRFSNALDEVQCVDIWSFILQFNELHIGIGVNKYGSAEWLQILCLIYLGLNCAIELRGSHRLMNAQGNGEMDAIYLVRCFKI